MTYEQINYGSTPNDPNADTLREAGIKIDNNFQQIYSVDAAGSPLTSAQNLVWATGDGTDAEASFRALTSSDLPATISGITIDNATLTSATLTAPTLNSPQINGGTLDNITLSFVTINNGEIENSNFTNCTFYGIPSGRKAITTLTDVALTTTPHKLGLDLTNFSRMAKVWLRGGSTQAGTPSDIVLRFKTFADVYPTLTVNHVSWDIGGNPSTSSISHDGTNALAIPLLTGAASAATNMYLELDLINFASISDKSYKYKIIYIEGSSAKIVEGFGWFSYANPIGYLDIAAVSTSNVSQTMAVDSLISYNVED